MFANLSPQPGATVIPPAFGSGHGNPHHLGGFLNRESHKKAQFDKFRLSLVLGGELIERLMDFEQFVVCDRPGDINFMNIKPLLSSAMSDSSFSPGVFDQDPPHRFGGGGKEVRAILPFLALAAAQSEPGLVNQRRGLQSLPG